MAFGKRRSKKQIAEFKKEILALLSKGLSRQDIAKVMFEKYKIPQRTFDRYWTSAMQEEEMRIINEKLDLWVSFYQRCLNRIREAQLNYEKTKDRAWLYCAHNIEKDFFEKMQSLGLIAKEPDKVEMSIEGKLIEAIKKARELKNNK